MHSRVRSKVNRDALYFVSKSKARRSSWLLFFMTIKRLTCQKCREWGDQRHSTEKSGIILSYVRTLRWTLHPWKLIRSMYNGHSKHIHLWISLEFSENKCYLFGDKQYVYHPLWWQTCCQILNDAKFILLSDFHTLSVWAVNIWKSKSHSISVYILEIGFPNALLTWIPFYIEWVTI